MIKIIIDNCILSYMGDLYKDFLQSGREGLIDSLAEKKAKREEVEDRLLTMIPEEYKNEHRGLTTEDLFKNFFDFHKDISSKIKDMTTEIERKQKRIDLFKDKIANNDNVMGLKKALNGFEVEMQRLLKERETLKEIFYKNFVGYGFDSKTFKDSKREHKNLQDEINAGKLLILSIDGKVDLHIVETFYREASFGLSGTELDDLHKLTSKHITLIDVKDEEIIQYINNLAEQYMDQIDSKDKTTPMDTAKNRRGEYGDQRGMAEVALAGIPLVTVNETDFIGERGKNENINKRQHIKAVGRKNFPKVSDVLPFSDDEFIDKGCDEPTYTSQYVYLRKVSESVNFKQTVIMERIK